MCHVIYPLFPKNSKNIRCELPILYFPIAHNTPCLPPKFCINYCFRILLGGLHISKTIVYAEFGGQTRCIMGNWKIEHAPKLYKISRLPSFHPGFSMSRLRVYTFNMASCEWKPCSEGLEKEKRAEFWIVLSKMAAASVML